CNNCQHYGHIRRDCKAEGACANCSSFGHMAATCMAGTHRCISCGTDSSHASSDCNCPTFRKQCKDLDSHFPENCMPTFPTNDPAS
ncbi:hypothetical protein J132_01949, partial [Termitomyces sp. J132]